MAILPSTSDTRGRSVASKTLSASDSRRSDSPEDGIDQDISLPNIGTGEEKPFAPAEGVAAPQELADESKSGDARDFVSDSEFWVQMTTTLDACFDSSKNSTNEAQLNTTSNGMLANAPLVMQTFLSHGEACTKIEAEALDLASNGPVSHDEDEPLRIYTNMLNDLEHLQERASSLEQSISRLAGIADADGHNDDPQDDPGKGVTEPAGTKLAAQSELRRVFAACLPVLRARKANLIMAQDLIDSAQENLSISLKMEYLGIN